MAKNRVKFVLDTKAMTVKATEGDKSETFTVTLAADSAGFKHLALYGFCSYLQNSVAPMKGEGLDKKGPVMKETALAINTGVKKVRANAKGPKEPVVGVAAMAERIREGIKSMPKAMALAFVNTLVGTDERLSEALSADIAELMKVEEAPVKGKGNSKSTK
jgi:hypothetical protein